MKIFELHYSTSWAGAERLVVDLSNALSKTNEVILCIIEDDRLPEKAYYKKDISPSIKYINLKCKSGLQLKALWRIYKAIKSEKPDIVHAHTDAICLFLPSLLYCKPTYFHTLHNLASICQRTNYLTSIYKWFYKRRIKPITISNICLQSYKKLYKIKNATNINNGRSELQMTKQHPMVLNEINMLKLHEDDKVFVHVARCDKQKNQSMLINVFNTFLEKGYHAILILIGANYDTQEYKSLLEKAHKGIYWLGIKNNVSDYLYASDFFILSSLWEGLPISLLEAISVGAIPICTPAGGIPDVITGKKIGYLSQDFNENSFYACIVEAYEKSSSFDKEYLKKYFADNFSIEACAKRYEEVFKETSKSKS